VELPKDDSSQQKEWRLIRKKKVEKEKKKAGRSKMPYRVKNLVSDISLVARFTDPNARNPIGLVVLKDALFVAQNAASVVSNYSLKGELLQTLNSPSNPTGLALNSTSGFNVTSGTSSLPSTLVVVTQNGVIAGWNPQVSPLNFITAFSSSDKVFRGVTIVSCSPNSLTPLLFVTNFRSGMVEIYSSTFQFLSSFTDTALTASGYSPFGITTFLASVCISSNGSKKTETPLLLVSFAQRNSTNDTDVKGIGNGYLDVFDVTGQLISRYSSRGPLNSPFGMVVGHNGILVANHGDGLVLKYETVDPAATEPSDLLRGAFQTAIRTSCEGSLVNDGIWSLARAKGTDAIFFTAGINDTHGLIGVFIPEQECEKRMSHQATYPLSIPSRVRLKQTRKRRCIRKKPARPWSCGC
jgi:uncharacterized protein (TIGR03118 family)